MNCPFVIKVCTKCKRILVAYRGNFNKARKGKWGLESKCRQCSKQYRKDNIERIREKERQYYKEHKEERLKYHEQYREEHKEELLEKKREYYKENREKILEYQKQYYKDNQEIILKRVNEYRKNNIEIIKERKKKYYEDNPHIQFNSHTKRRCKLESQGRGITKEQWVEMMCWFDWCCAYSDRYIGGNSEHRTIDHIIALDNNGLNEPWNCVPCFDSYNYSKCAKDMLDWYIQQEFYSEERLIKIYAWCEYAFNKWKPRRKGNKMIIGNNS